MNDKIAQVYITLLQNNDVLNWSGVAQTIKFKDNKIEQQMLSSRDIIDCA